MDKGGLSIDAETVICQSLTRENMGGAITTGCSFAADCSQKEEEAARERWAGRFTALWARMSRRRRRRLGSSIREGRSACNFAVPLLFQQFVREQRSVVARAGWTRIRN